MNKKSFDISEKKILKIFPKTIDTNKFYL